MSEIVNLRQARKAKARAEAEVQAARNRVTFGRTKTERQASEARGEREQRLLDGHRRDKPPAENDDGQI